jgi:sodium transport system ATP-binding protein
MEKTMIQVEKLSKQFTDKKLGLIKAVDNVSFQCKPGKIFGLLGPNGAGKTTTLRMIATILNPTSGAIVIGGIDAVSHSDQVRGMIGFLTGDTGLYERLTGRETLNYFGKLYGYGGEKIAQRMEMLSSKFGLADFIDRRIGTMSVGMRQKISLARTMIHDPDILILDEPTAGLDIITTRNIVDFIRLCRDEGKCILFSTHIMHEAEALCNEIAFINRGRILDCGTMTELKTRHELASLEDIFFKLMGADNEL